MQIYTLKTLNITSSPKTGDKTYELVKQEVMNIESEAAKGDLTNSLTSKPVYEGILSNNCQISCSCLWPRLLPTDSSPITRQDPRKLRHLPLRKKCALFLATPSGEPPSDPPRTPSAPLLPLRIGWHLVPFGTLSVPKLSAKGSLTGYGFSVFAAPMTSNTQCMVVLRHALRLDEVDHDFLTSSKACWDPPLAPAGFEQVQCLSVARSAV